jgi:hypothetical protein
MGPHSCWLLRICSAYADFALFCLIYLWCSLHMKWIFVPHCPTYTLRHVLLLSSQIPLCSYLSTCGLGLSRLFNVLEDLKVLKMIGTFRIRGLWNVKVTQLGFSVEQTSLRSSCFSVFLLMILLLILFIQREENPLRFAIYIMVSNSAFLCASDKGSLCILWMMALYAAILCSGGDLMWQAESYQWVWVFDI